jgi:hypothetical protein
MSFCNSEGAMSQKRLHSRRGEVVARHRGEQPVPTAGWDGQVPSGGGRAGFSTLCGSAPRAGPAAALRHARLTGTEIRVEGWTGVAWVAPRTCGGRLRRAGRRDPVAAWGPAASVAAWRCPASADGLVRGRRSGVTAELESAWLRCRLPLSRVLPSASPGHLASSPLR